MQRLLLVLCATLIASGPAHAIKRVNVTTLSCDQAKALVESEGAVIYRYPSQRNASLTLFARFVAHRGFCSNREVTTNKTVPTATGSCKLRICVQNEENFFGRRNQMMNFGIN